MINDADKTFIKKSFDFVYGFNMSLNYDNFDFSIQGNGVQGNEIFNATNNRLLDNADSLNKLDFTPWSTSNTNTRFRELFLMTLTITFVTQAFLWKMVLL